MYHRMKTVMQQLTVYKINTTKFNMAPTEFHVASTKFHVALTCQLLPYYSTKIQRVHHGTKPTQLQGSEWQ